MGIFSKFENRMEDVFDNAAEKMFDAPLSPVQIAKKAEKQMMREKMVGAGKQYAPTLYTVLVSPEDDERFFGYYPTLAGETETYLSAKASDAGLITDGAPLVRFIADDNLRRGKFDVIAEIVAGPIVEKLREEEYARYGIALPQRSQHPQQENRSAQGGYQSGGNKQPFAQGQGQGRVEPLSQEAQEQPFAQAPQEQVEVAKTSLMPNVASTLSPAANGAGGNLAPQAQLIDLNSNQTFNLSNTPARLTLGRETSNYIIVNDLNASRFHAEIHFDPQSSWTITDLSSTNGTYVNAREITTCPLHDGDSITIGLTNYVFRLV